MHLELHLASRRTLQVLVVIAAAFALAHAGVMLLTFGLGFNELFGMRRLLDLNEEQNLPTFYSALLLLAAAGLLTVLAADARRRQEVNAPDAHTRDARSRPDAGYWTGLAILFAFFAIDEAASIHELLNAPLRAYFEGYGALYFAWVVPYALFALVVAFVYIPFLLRLPRSVASRIVAAGIIFVAGAVGVEAIEGILVGSMGHGYQSLPMEIAYLVEELMEMLGVSYFIAALLYQVELSGAPLRLRVE